MVLYTAVDDAGRGERPGFTVSFSHAVPCRGLLVRVGESGNPDELSGLSFTVQMDPGYWV